MPSGKRRHWCDTPNNLEGRKFTPDMVVTLHIWQHLIDFSAYKLAVGSFLNVDLAPALNAQPLQLTLKDIKARTRAFARGVCDRAACTRAPVHACDATKQNSR